MPLFVKWPARITAGTVCEEPLAHIDMMPTLAAAELEKLAELQALLHQHDAGARAPLYPAVTESSIAIDKTLAERFEDGDEYIY